MDDYSQIGLSPEEYASEKLGIPNLSELKAKKQTKVLNKFKEDQQDVIIKFQEDETAIKKARDEYVRSSSALYTITPTVEEGLSFEEAVEKAGKRFDKKLTQTEQIAFYQKAVLSEQLKSAGAITDNSEKIKELEATVVSKEKKISELEKKLKTATSDKTPAMMEDLNEKLKETERLLAEKEDEINSLKERLKETSLDESKVIRKRRAESLKNAPAKPKGAIHCFQEDKGFKTYAEARTEYKKLTDDEKSKYIILTSKDAKRYAREYEEFLQSLPEEDRSAFMEKRPRLESTKPKVSQIFPGMPEKPPGSLRALIQKEEMEKALKKTKKQAEFESASNQAEKFAIQSKAVTAYIERLSEKDKKKREEKLAKLAEAYDQEMKKWYDELEEEHQAMYDRAIWIDNRGKAPAWVESQPKPPSVSFRAYCIEYVKRKLEDDATKEEIEAAYKEFKEKESRVEKLRARHKEELTNFPETLNEWIESLNEFQKEVYYENQRLCEGGKISKEDLEFCQDILQKISDAPDDELTILSEQAVYEKVKGFHLEEAGVKFVGNRRKLSEKRLQKAWKKANAEGVDAKFMKSILERVVASKKQEIQKEEKKSAGKKERPKKTQRSAFQKKMDKEFGGDGHPAKPKSIYDVFKAEYLESGLIENLKEAFQAFKKDKKRSAQATLEYEKRKDDYKQQVLEWINSIGPEEKKKYQEEHMKDFTITEVCSTSSQSIEDAADRLVYLDPKTPAAYDPSFLHAADDDEDDDEE